jgi:hypothetical protein
MYSDIPNREYWEKFRRYIQKRNLVSPGEATKISRKLEFQDPTDALPYSAVYLMKNLERREGAWFFVAKHEARSLGTGRWGRVKIAYDEDGRLYALKITTPDFLATPNNPHRIPPEVSVLEQIGKLNAFGWIGNKHYCLQELILGISLETLLEQEDRTLFFLTLQQQQSIFLSLCIKLYELHELKIAHGDLHIANIMINLDVSPVEVTIIDFGQSIMERSSSPLFNFGDTKLKDVTNLIKIFFKIFDFKNMISMGLLTHDLFTLLRNTYRNPRILGGDFLKTAIIETAKLMHNR